MSAVVILLCYIHTEGNIFIYTYFQALYQMEFFMLMLDLVYTPECVPPKARGKKCVEVK